LYVPQKSVLPYFYGKSTRINSKTAFTLGFVISIDQVCRAKSTNSGDSNQRADYSILADCDRSDRSTVAISSRKTKLTQTIYAQVPKIS
jgi:hypothetical protein